MDPRLDINSTGFSFSLRGQNWPTLQHYFQAQKFHGTKIEEVVRLAPTPNDAVRIAEENSAFVRSNWEKIHPEILYEGTLSKFDQHSQLRELLTKTEIFVGESANVLLKAQAFFRRLEPNECAMFDLYEDENVVKKDFSDQPVLERREKARNRRNVWKDNSGGSLLEISSSNTVALVENSSLNIPINALPNNAKFVVKKYQYEKRYLNDDSDEYYEEEEEDRKSSERSGKIYLADFIQDGRGVSIPDFLNSAKKKLEELQNSRLDGSNVEELVAECKSNQIQAQELIEKGEVSETFLDQLLQLLDSLNSVLF